MIETLIEINNGLIEKYKNDEKLLKKYEIIKEILFNKTAFFNMQIETSYSLLRDLGIKEEDLQSCYIQLITPKS